MGAEASAGSAIATPGAIPGLCVFLINLDRSGDRLAAMTGRLSTLGLDYARFSAVDGAAEWDRLSQTLDDAAFSRNVGRDVMRAEIGAYHSHLGVWRAFLATDADVALVLEDDVVFHDDFSTAIGLAMGQQRRWDFLKLNRIRAQFPVRRGTLGPYTLNAYRGSATGLGAYLITRSCAARLLPAMLPITRPIDHELDRTFVHRFRHYGLEPFPSHVDDGGQSTITGASFAGVRKFAKWRRLPAYALRLRNLIGKTLYLTHEARE